MCIAASFFLSYLVPGFLGAHAHAPPFVDIHVVVVVVVVPAKVVLLAARGEKV